MAFSSNDFRWRWNQVTLIALYYLTNYEKDKRTIDEHENRIEEPDNELPLPCHYFDLIIGTSTGGYVVYVNAD